MKETFQLTNGGSSPGPLGFLLSLLIALCFLTGCANRPTRTSDGEAIFHTVQYSGETLGIISTWYTGSPKNWKVIRDKNQEIDYRCLQIGDEIYIPSELVKRRRPLTPVFVASLSRKEAKRPASRKPTAHEVPAVTEEPVSLPETAAVQPEESQEEQQVILSETRDELLRSLLESE